MLTDITPGFYRMRNGRMAFVKYVFTSIIGYIEKEFESREAREMTWYEDGFYLYKEESQYDLMEKITC
jgi:hypothetical protein